VQQVHAVVLAGGSAFGLDAATGVMQYLEESGVGFDAGVARVPIVPSAALFDLALGDSKAHPDAAMGYAASRSASTGPVAEGNVGAGCGASVGKIWGMERATKSGLGSSSIHWGDGLVIGAIVAVNALGSVVDPDTGAILGGPLDLETGLPLDTVTVMKTGMAPQSPSFSNTTIGVVATNAHLDKEEANKIASMAQNGLARTIRPPSFEE
jgi:L-aminopeptidase/D-esterase-like protein